MKTKQHIILSEPMAQSSHQTQNNSIHRKWFALALGGLLFTSIFALSPPPVEAQCQQWNVGHGWRLKQGSTNVDFDLHQNGTVVTGTARFFDRGSSSSGSFGRAARDVTGDVDGTVKGNRFAVIIHWDNGSTGVYNSTIGASGRIEGTTYDQAAPSQKVNWYSETRMVCADGPIGKMVTPPPAPTKSSGYKSGTTQLPVVPGSSGGTAGGFIQMHTPTPQTPTPSAEADESSSDDTQDQHKKNKKKKKHHHHHDDDDQNQGND